MIRALLILWFVPFAIFCGWYVLSFYDISFGTDFFSRALHDQVFAFYGTLLAIGPAAIPALIAQALIADGLVVLAVVAFRKRKAVAALSASLLGRNRHSSASPNEESLSSAP